MNTKALEVCKVVVGLLFVALFFIPTNTITFAIIASLMIGGTYYLLCETQPQVITLIFIVANHYWRQIYKKISSWFNVSVDLNKNQIKNKLDLEDNFNSLTFHDSKPPYKKYIYLFNEKYRSNDLVIFKDEHDNDISDYIEPYLGPMQNFFGSPITPRDFNHKKITVFRDGNINLLKTFEENESICFGTTTLNPLNTN